MRVSRSVRIIAAAAAAVLVAILGAAGAVALGSSSAPPGWLVPSAPERMQMVVQAPSSLTSTLAGFPVKVLLKPDTFDYTHADPQHLVFTAGDDATALPYEVEQWDPNGTSTVWVKLPALSATAANVDVYFGDGAPENATSPAGVWDGHYLAVNHFDAASATQRDSTSNGFDGTLSGANAETTGPGQAGQNGGLAVALNGTDGKLDFGTTIGESVSDYTFSTTVDVTAAMLTDGKFHMIGGRDQYSGSHAGEQYAILLNNGHVYASQYPARNTSQTDAAAAVTAGWHTFTSSYESATSTLTLYVDGTLATTLRSVPAVPTSSGGALLNFLLGTYTPNGATTTYTAFTYDEFRLSDELRSADQVKADFLAQTDQLVTASHYQTQDDVTGTDPTTPTTPRGGPTDWQLPSAERRLQVAVQAPGVGSAVTNFPVLVQFDTSNFDYGSATPDHLVFLADGDDTPLPYEIERWNTHGASTAWVKVPSLDSTAKTLNLYYDGTPLNTTDATDVWEADYATVNHFASDEGTLDDSTQNGWRGTAATGAGQYQQETGSRTYGFTLNGTDGAIDFGAAIGADLEHYTYSATVNVTSAMAGDSTYHQIGGRDQYSGVHPGEQFSMLIYRGHAYASLYTGAGSVATSQADADSAVTAGWHTFTQTYDGSMLRLYIDGALAESVASTARVSHTDLIHFLLGSYTANDGSTTFTPFTYDEMRISDTVRSADWIKAEYLAQSNQLATAAATSQTQNGNVLLSVTAPGASATVGSSMTLTGTVDQPATVTYKLDAGDEVSLGSVTGAFSAPISGLSDGDHHLTVTATGNGDGNTTTRTVDFTSDATAPQIVFNTPHDGQKFGVHQSFKLDVATSDPSGVATTTLKIDGTSYADGDTIGADDLTPGAHTLVVTAADRLDNSASRQIGFSTGAEASFSGVTPADGAKGLDPAHTTLGITATNALGGSFDLVFKRGYVADAGDGGIDGAAQGSSTTAQPGRDGGDAVVDSSGIEARDDGSSLVTDSTDAYPYQRFDVKVPSSLGSSRFTPKWSGTVPAGDRAALSVWNKTTSAWQLVDSASGDGDRMTLSGDAAVADTVTDGKAELLVQDAPEHGFGNSSDTLKTAWVTDTQFYSESNPRTFDAETQWVLDHNNAAAPADQIRYGFLTGDIVNAAGQGFQWTNASPAMQRWDDAGFPYGIVEGNHDLTVCNYTSSNGCGPSDAQNSQLPAYATYQSYFGADRYAANPWYGGSQFDNAQHYDVLSTPKADYLFVYLDLYLTPDEITWANQVIRSHPNDNVILATHEYTEQNGSYVTEQPLSGVGIGQRIYNQIAAPNRNVIAVFSGHVWPSEHRQTKDLGNGRVLDEILYDPQSQPNQGNGWMATVDFDTAHQTITKREFSVTNAALGNNYMGNESQANFTIPMNVTAPDRVLSTDYVAVSALGSDTIGEAHDVASGAPATAAVSPSLLRIGEPFAWYVTATDDDGAVTTSPLYELTPAAAFDTTVVQITGTPKQGQTLTADTSGFSPRADAYTYGWLADGTAIDGQTDATLKLTAGMVGKAITVSVHATKADYAAADATSTAVTVVDGDFTPGELSVDGDAKVGHTVTAQLDAWDPQPAAGDIHYQWLLDGSAIQGATAATYAIPADQVGKALSVRVTIDGVYGGLQTTSTGVSIGAGTLDAGSAPAVSGTAKVGKTVTAEPGSSSPADDGHPSYQWLLDGQPVAGQTQPTYVIKPSDADAALRVRVTHHKAGYADLDVSSAAVTVAKGDFAAGAPTISGPVKVGEEVSAVAGAWSPNPESVTYQWLLDGHAVSGATAATYTITAADNGHRLSVAIGVHAAGYTDGSATSDEQKVAAGTLLASTDPTMHGTFQVGETIGASAGTWSHDARTTGYQWLLDGQPIAGATSASYTLPATAAGHWLSVQVTAEADGYAPAIATSQSMSIASPPVQGTGPTPPFGDPSGPSTPPAGTPFAGGARHAALKPLARPSRFAVSGSKRVGTTVKVKVAKGKWPAHTTLRYQWYAGGKKIKGATKPSYKVAARYRGKKLTVKVTGSRKGFRSVTVTVAAGKVAAAAKASTRTRDAVRGTAVTK